MLTHDLIQNPDAKRAVYEQLFSGSWTFVVSDLQTKLWLQSAYLQATGAKIVPGSRFFRASEFWQTCLKDCDWRWRPIPQELVSALLEGSEDSDDQLSSTWSPLESPVLSQTLGQMLPILSHPQGEEMIEDWFQLNPEAANRWARWYRRARQGWEKLLTMRTLPQDWMKAVLLSEEFKWPANRPLLFDLDLDFDEIEGELILNLSRITDVRVLIPVNRQNEPAYQELISRSIGGQTVVSDSPTKRLKCLKLPSRLSEVKQATAQIRMWLDSGLVPDEIGIVSPQIEEYWPSFQGYLQTEGIPVEKGVATPLSQIPVLQKWMSVISWRLGQANRDDLELTLFTQLQARLPFTSFKARYESVYDGEDLKKLPLPSGLSIKPENPERPMTLTEFLQWSLRTEVLSQREQHEIVELLATLDEVLNFQVPLSGERWLRFFQFYLAHREKPLLSGQAGGVALVHPGQASLRPFKALFILGLSEDALREGASTPLLYGDIESLKFHFGVNLRHREDQSFVEKMNWWLEKSWQECVLSYSETDFSGAFQAPSLFWLRLAVEQKHSLEVETPLWTRRDELMNEQALKIEDSTLESPILMGLRRDQSGVGFQPVQIPGLSLSASKMEELFKCPFRFLAQAGFGLRSESVYDIDLDSMNRGRLLHRICEVLLRHPSFSLNEGELESLIDQCAQDLHIEFYSQEAWDFSRPFYLRFARDFLQFELKWRQEFPDTSTKDLELFVSGHVDFVGGKAQFGSKGWPFKGLIDRIDRSPSGDLVLIDYKSSGGSLSQYISWYEKGLLQLVFYALAIQDQMILSQSRVIGLYYYVMTEMDRGRGVHCSSYDQAFLPKAKLSEEDFQAWLERGREILGELLGRLKMGELEPKPSNPNLCQKCDVKKICRYKELNT